MLKKFLLIGAFVVFMLGCGKDEVIKPSPKPTPPKVEDKLTPPEHSQADEHSQAPVKDEKANDEASKGKGKGKGKE